MNTPIKRRKSLAEREKYIAFFENFMKYRSPKLLREMKSLYDISNGNRNVKKESDLHRPNSVIKTEKQFNDHLLADISRPSTSYQMPSTSDEVIDLYSEETVCDSYEPRDYACIENKVSEISPSKKFKPVEFTNEINVSKNLFASPAKKQQKPFDSPVQRNSSEMAFFRAEIDPRKLQSSIQLNRPGSSKETGVSFAKNQHSTAPKKYWIQVGNLDESISERDMLRHLHSKFPLYNDFVCKELKTTGSYSAFKVGVNEELKHEICLPNYWPSNAIIKDITAQFGNN